jgi:peptidoglycan/xylan/chitin deacetylase (PgdA/CDA1 family)
VNGPAPSPALYTENGPEAFWRLLRPEPSSREWSKAAAAAIVELPLSVRRGGSTMDAILFNTLGEGQFGPRHWRLGRWRRGYYRLKPLLPRPLTRWMRSAHRKRAEAAFTLGWPVEPRFVRFQERSLAQLLERRGSTSASFLHFWPQGRRFALVLTHDIETAGGQAFAGRVADLEERLGFHSSFNFVAEDYALDHGLIADLRARGFEVALHGCKHDGRLFSSRRMFAKRAKRINRHLRALGAVGFRSPLTHRHPAWMQDLEIDYDLSFFDTDPYEPLPGGVMTIWPFRIGRFIELPYTLAQDHTLFWILGQRTPRIWLEKLEFIRRHCGLALLNTHPDYLSDPGCGRLYEALLNALHPLADEFWQALPRDAARWWATRSETLDPAGLPGSCTAHLQLAGGELQFTLPSIRPGEMAAEA